ncbi:MAG: SpoIIE family protein phosphatase [Prevotella sp.]|nr:SpoIIE family protein phosphatase [Prevotella sp.]
MKKHTKIKSFAKRLTGRIMLMLLIVMGLASYLIYQLTSELVEDLMIEETQNKLSTSVQKVRRVLSDVYVATSNHVPFVEESLDQPDRLFELMERVVSLNPLIRSCGISFVADYYPQKGRWFCPYAVRRDSSLIERKSVGGADQDYLKAQWFIKAFESKKGLWSKPFFEGNDTITPLVSYMVPIHDKQGRTVAVLGADVSLEWLSESLQKMTRKMGNVNNEACSFIIGGDGTYIAHTEKKHVLKDNFLKETEATADTLDNYLCRKMMAGKKGVYPNVDSYVDGEEEERGERKEERGERKLIINGKSVYLFYAPIEHTGWSMALMIPSFDIKGMGIFVGVVLLLMIFTSLLVVYFLARHLIKRTTKPLHQLATSANDVAKGNFHTPLPTLKHNDEIHQLRDSFEEMQQSLTKYVDELKTTTASKAAIEKELKVAHDIQMSMLPKIFPPFPDRDDIDIAGSLTPAKDVGGDLFDFYIRDEQLFFCIGDVSGKGVPASLVMAVTRTLFRNVSAHESEPGHVVESLNDALAETNDTNMFVTFFVGVLDLNTGMMNYCNAGHDMPLLVGRGVGMLPCDANLPIGVMQGWKYSQQETSIDPQTVIFLYTDGLNEAENEEHIQFGATRLLRVAESQLADGKCNPASLIREMTKAVRAFVGDAEQSDDLTMLAIQYKNKNILDTINDSEAEKK